MDLLQILVWHVQNLSLTWHKNSIPSFIQWISVLIPIRRISLIADGS